MAPTFLTEMTGHLSKPWGANLLSLNMETGITGEPAPPELWDRIVRHPETTYSHVMLFSIVHECVGSGVTFSPWFGGPAHRGTSFIALQ